VIYFLVCYYRARDPLGRESWRAAFVTLPAPVLLEPGTPDARD
jgi:hypothetical protein